MRTVITLAALFFCLTGYSQFVVTGCNPEFIIKDLLADPAFKMKDGKPTNAQEVVRTQTAASLLGSLCSKWEDDYEFPVTYKIVSIQLRDTLYEKDEMKKILATYDDTTSGVYGTVKWLKDEIVKAEEKYKSGTLSEASYNIKVEEYGKMIAGKMKEIEAAKASFYAEYTKAKTNEIIKIVTVHTIVVNDIEKVVEVDYTKKKEGGWSSSAKL